MYNPNKDFALEIENQIDRNPVLPIGDRYIGTLVNATTIGYAIYSMRFLTCLTLRRHMSSSMSICMPFKTETEDKNDICLIRGLTLAHKYNDPKEIERSFHSLVSGDFSCKKYEPNGLR